MTIGLSKSGFPNLVQRGGELFEVHHNSNFSNPWGNAQRDAGSAGCGWSILSDGLGGSDLATCLKLSKVTSFFPQRLCRPLLRSHVPPLETTNLGHVYTDWQCLSRVPDSHLSQPYQMLGKQGLFACKANTIPLSDSPSITAIVLIWISFCCRSLKL